MTKSAKYILSMLTSLSCSLNHSVVSSILLPNNSIPKAPGCPEAKLTPGHCSDKPLKSTTGQLVNALPDPARLPSFILLTSNTGLLMASLIFIATSPVSDLSSSSVASIISTLLSLLQSTLSSNNLKALSLDLSCFPLYDLASLTQCSYMFSFVGSVVPRFLYSKVSSSISQNDFRSNTLSSYVPNLTKAFIIGAT